MPESLVETAAQLSDPSDERIYGVAVAQVVNNVDVTGKARVQVKLPWLPGVEPWARLAVLSAGKERGTYFVPQIGDEVLVAFNQGDVREPFVLGSLWNAVDPPPTDLPSDAVSKRIVKTPAGHEIVLDDLEQSVTVKTSTGHEVRLTTEAIELETTGGTASMRLGLDGAVAIESAAEIRLKSSLINLEAQGINLEGTAVNLNGQATCSIAGGTVRLN